jgi:hypothetical protein
MEARSPGVKQHIEDGECKTSEDVDVTVMIKIHFDKVLRSHHYLINRSEYFCHKGIGICTACRNHKRAVVSSFMLV